MRIAHVITGLHVGGAERMLYRLLSGMRREEFEHEVISLTDMGPIGEKIQDLGIRVRCLGMNRKAPNPIALYQLRSLLKKWKPRVVQTWMMHSDLLGGLAAFLGGRFPVVWGVHQTVDYKLVDWRSRVTAQCCTRLASKIPTKIVCCSEASISTCAALGYPRSKMVLIPNGFDLGTLYRDVDGARAVRNELHLSENAPIVGLVARFHPQKDHKTFFQASELLLRRIPEVHFVLCGDGVTLGQPTLHEMVASSSSPASFHLLGRRDDIRSIVSAFTVATLSSMTEAFPLSIGEAMCCETPCAATDVGDVPRIIGKTGRVVSAGNALQLSQAWFDLLKMSSAKRRDLGRAARERIGHHFSLSSVVSQYETLYGQVGAG